MYARWKKSKVFEPSWTKYMLGWLQHKKQGAKGAEFDHVYKHIVAGETSGVRKYSGEEPEKNVKDGVEWGAWILSRLVHINTTDRNGCFFKRNTSELEKYRLLWFVILHETWDSDRKGTRARVATEAQDNHSIHEEAEIEEEPIELPRVSAIIRWVNVPDHLMDGENFVETIILEEFYSYNETAFQITISARFELGKYSLHRDVLEYSGGPLTFKDVRGLVIHKKLQKPQFMLKTQEGLFPGLEEEPLSPPIGLRTPE